MQNFTLVGVGAHSQQQEDITDAAPPPFPSLNAPQGSGGLSQFCTFTVCEQQCALH